MKRKRWTVLALAGVLFMVIVNGVLWRLEYRNYQEKVNLLYAMAAGEAASPFDAAQILKGKEKLVSHGYSDRYTDVYKQNMYRNIGIITAMSLAGYTIFLLLLVWAGQQAEKSRTREWDEVRRMIGRVRSGEWKQQSAFPGVRDEQMEFLRMELESLSAYVSGMEQSAQSEREETKSLVTDISHQLKTPVAALNTSYKIMMEPDLTVSERREFTQRLKNQIERLEELIKALVNISRMETGLIEIQAREEKIFDTLILAVNRIYPATEEKQIEISLEAEPEEEQLVLPHDPKWLSEAVINVLENAVKYSPAHTTITIRMMKMSSMLRIEIEDEGIGIPVQERHKIFQRFYRGDSGLVKKSPGSGVGLYLTRRILEQHHGTITVKAPAGQREGSCFVLQLPFK